MFSARTFIPLSLIMAAVLSAHAEIPAGYTALDLGTLGGGSSYAYGINNAGKVVGSSDLTGGGYHAFVYSGGVMTDIGTLGGATSSASAVNNAGFIVGGSLTVSSGVSNRAFLYNPTTTLMTDLGTLPGGSTSNAFDINSLGQVVGTSSNASGYDRAFLYSGGAMMDIGTLGGNSATAYGINDAGQIVGTASTASGDQHNFLYTISTGTMIDLGSITSFYSAANAINESGQIVGVDASAYVYSGGVKTSLGALGAFGSTASDINESGLIVGSSSDGDGGFKWTLGFVSGGTGMTKLTDITDFSGTSLIGIHNASGINDSGLITGYADVTGGGVHAMILTPVPEPSGLALLALGVAGMIRRRQRA